MKVLILIMLEVLFCYIIKTKVKTPEANEFNVPNQPGNYFLI